MQISVKETANLLNVSEATIYRWIRLGTIPAYRINGQYRLNRAKLLEWALSKRMRVYPDVFHESEQSKAPLPTLSLALTAGGIMYNVKGSDKPSVLRSVVDMLKLPEDVDREFLYEVLIAREALGSTGIGEGIAIPHVRNPVVLPVLCPSVTLCFLDNPIDFKAIDGKPVDTLFTLISPTVRAHLHLLSRLGFVLQNQELRAALASRLGGKAIMEQLSSAEDVLPANGNNHASEPRTSARKVD
ncbi:MAG: PTS sugar transporter subunit IIA [Planctomycetes bacterium]|nr:PTS sugar transporter subunit IIA [Planctomycetota bacterium]